MKTKDIVEMAGIYTFDKEDPMDPEVLVDGVGRYKLSQVKRNVREKLQDLAARVAETDDPRAWREVGRLINHGAMHEMIRTIVQTHDELQEIRSKGGPRSRGIEKE